MKPILTKPLTIDNYISHFPIETQELLEQLRKTVQKAAPKATEVISYGMPAFKLNGVLVYFAGYAHHIGFYPTPSGITAFKQKLSNYKSSKGAVQFPLNMPLPVSLITSIVKFRLAQDIEKMTIKKIIKKK